MPLNTFYILLQLLWKFKFAPLLVTVFLTAKQLNNMWESCSTHDHCLQQDTVTMKNLTEHKTEKQPHVPNKCQTTYALQRKELQPGASQINGRDILLCSFWHNWKSISQENKYYVILTHLTLKFKHYYKKGIDWLKSPKEKTMNMPFHTCWKILSADQTWRKERGMSQRILVRVLVFGPNTLAAMCKKYWRKI